MGFSYQSKGYKKIKIKNKKNPTNSLTSPFLSHTGTQLWKKEDMALCLPRKNGQYRETARKEKKPVQWEQKSKRETLS